MSSEVMVLMKVISYILGIFVTMAVLLKDMLTVWIITTCNLFEL